MKMNMKSNSLLKRKNRISKISVSVIRAIMLMGFAYIILSPLFIMISRSVMEPSDLYDNSIIWIPRHFSLSTIRITLKALTYESAFFNSVWISLLVTALQVVACLMAGYGFGRFEFPFKKVLFAGVIFTLLVPPQMLLLPTYLNFKEFDIFGIIKLITGNNLNLLSTPLPIFLLAITANGIKNGLFIYIFRQFFKNMPRETEEAASVDGAGAIRTFVSIMVPSASNAIITVVLFSFVWQWNDMFYSNLFLGDVTTLSLAYNKLNFSTDTIAVVDSSILNYNLLNQTIQSAFKGTAVLLILIPLIILFVFLQRYFVESLERSGVVG